MDKLNLNDDRQIIILHDIKEDLQRVYDHFRSVENQNEYLRKEIEKLKDERFKDEELTRMKEDYERMKTDYYRGFPITEEQKYKINMWMAERYKTGPQSKIALAANRFTYIFTPTELGVIGTIHDGVTGEDFTFQDFV